MMERFGNYVVNRLIEAEIIKQSEKEIYEYGFMSILTNLMNLTTAMAIGFMMGQIWQCLLFQIMFIPLRVNAGGYHASTERRCFFLSIAMLVLALALLPLLPLLLSRSAGIMVMAASSAVIALLSPVENINKPLEQVERQVYGRRTRIVLLFEALLGVSSIYFFKGAIFWIINLVLLSVAISLGAGTMANHITAGRNNYENI
ncbi:MAG: accessory gene regulator B family protein [Clostridium sp.]|nr:accessory gene regulator B family protein [Clostridium sp.]